MDTLSYVVLTWKCLQNIPCHTIFVSEMGYFRILAGHNALGIEMEAAWATPGAFTVHNFPCYEDGGNCVKTHYVEDPSKNVAKVHARLAQDKKKYSRRRLQKTIRG
jgi:hypothetical protein